MKKIFLSLLAINVAIFAAEPTEMQQVCKGIEESMPGVKKILTDAYSIKMGKKLSCEDIPGKAEIENLGASEQFGLLSGLYYSFVTPNQPSEIKISKECGSAVYEDAVSKFIAKSDNKIDKMKEILYSYGVDGGIFNTAVCQKLVSKK